MPTRRSLHLTDADIRASYAARIGVQFRAADAPAETCAACGRTVPAPADGLSHALACSANSKAFRHDAARRELAAAIRVMGCQVDEEERVWSAHPRPASTSALRADLLISSRGQTDALDVTIVHPRISTTAAGGASDVKGQVLAAWREVEAQGGRELDAHFDGRDVLAARIAGAVTSHADDQPDGATYRFNNPTEDLPGAARPQDPLGLRGAVTRAEGRKRAKYGATVRIEDPNTSGRPATATFSPFVITTAGGLSETSAQLLRRLAQQDVAADAALDRGLAVAKAGLLARAALSTAVQRGNARIWLHHHGREAARIAAADR